MIPRSPLLLSLPHVLKTENLLFQTSEWIMRIISAPRDFLTSQKDTVPREDSISATIGVYFY